MIRIGHMGWCSTADIDGCLEALAAAVADPSRRQALGARR
jgi:aspartate aminotransferase-like enzyme